MNILSANLRKLAASIRIAYGVIRDPKKIEKHMELKGVKIESGRVNFYGFTPLGIFDDKVIVQTFGDLEKAFEGLKHINDSLNSNTSGKAKFTQILERLPALNKALKLGDFEALHQAYDKLADEINNKLRSSDKKKVMEFIKSVGEIITGSNGTLVPVDESQIKKLSQEIEATSQAIIAAIDRALKNNYERNKAIAALRNMQNKFPDVLQQLSGVGSVQIDRDAKVIELKGGDHVEQVVAKAILDGDILKFNYKKQDGSIETKKVKPLKFIPLKNGKGFSALDLEKDAERQYYLSSVQ